MKATIEHLLNKPLARIAVAGAGGAVAGTACIWLADAPWWVAPATCGGSMLMQWAELRWTSYRMRLLLKARRRARISQLKRQA